MFFKKTAAVILGLALAAAVSAATLVIDEQLPAGEYILTPVVAPPVDSDTDGFPDDVDACPDEYGTEPDGCPLPPVDTDGDGLPDNVDACPTEPAQTEDGCPLPPPDADGDGVPDDIDQCADTPAGDTVDSVGCTVTPPDPGDLAATPIGQLAATVPPGETRLLPGSPAVQGYREDGTPAPQTDEWTSSAYWYPGTNTSWFMGLRVSHRFISYDAETDTWREINLDGVENAVPRFPGPGHAYERGALDAGRGHFYYLNAGVLHRYVIAEDRWEQFEGTGMDGQILEWNDSLDMLINHNANTLIGFRDGQTFALPAPIVHGYHSSARFNKVRGDMLMLGGNYSLRTVALMLPDGTVQQRGDAPFDFHINANDLTYDPLTGNYLVSVNRTIWEYNPDLDEWREAPWKNGYPLHNYSRQVPIAIDELGIVAWQTEKGLILYRHESVFDPAEIPEPPVAVDPGEPAPPVVVEPPVSGTDTLLADQAATMEPGEWRNIANLTTWPGKDEGVKFKEFQYVYNGSTGADGMGWTQDLVYDDGRLMLVLNRSGIQRALIVMESDGSWWRITEPEGLVGNDRRPFNKLNQDDDHLYFSPNGCKECMGYFVRTPLDNPGVFERYGIPIGDDQMDSVGNFAVEWVPEWGRFYAYTPGGKLWTWTHGETEWTLLDRLKGHFTGYAGVAQWNPVKKELAIGGGQFFGDGEDLGNHFAVLTEPMGKMQIVPDLFKPDGEKLSYTSAEGRLIVDPRDGSYFLISGKQMYHSDTLGGTYEHYSDLGAEGGYPLGKWEMYAPYNVIPGTDVLVFVSHIEGVVLHRLKDLAEV